MLSAAVCDSSIAAPGQDETARLLGAVRSHRPDAVRLMIAHGVDVDAVLPGDGTALIAAAKHGDLAMVDALIALGADVNRSARGDGNPLIAASAAGRYAVMERLLANGANIDTISPDDETALISAVRGDHLPAIELLVERGADINLGALANGRQWRTPLNQARSPKVREFLVERGATAEGHRMR
jgi:ankyrin repeat protein